jgi:NAD-dependent dihydropyrimidine dehydrogenase PreA subunit
MTYVIALPCVDVMDKACVDECPIDCIYEGERMLYIQPDVCIDCGACEPACPVEALYFEDDLPAEFRVYATINAEFVTAIGSPDGASRVGRVLGDHPFVAALPPQIHDRPA